MLSGRYQDEQIQLEADVKKLKETLNQTVASKENAERWISIICKYRLINKHTPICPQNGQILHTVSLTKGNGLEYA